MELQVLHPNVVRELLQGYISCLPTLTENDDKARAAITKQECPHSGCGQHLVPAVPSDPSRIFDKTGVRYEKWCPQHGRVT